MSRPTRIDINPKALAHNLKMVKRAAPTTKIMAMAKANAYGHGIAQCIDELSHADAIGVCSIDEALFYKKHGTKTPLVLMEGFFESSELQQVSQNDFHTVIHCSEQIEILESVSLTKPLQIWLKIDSGMHRLGVAISEVKTAYQRLMQCQNVKKPLGLMTHFALADELDNPMTQNQLKCYQEAVQGLQGIHSLANSASILQWPETHGDWVRPGIMLYGISPFADRIGSDFSLKPVMNFRSHLIAVHEFKCGDCIGYGARYCCPEDMRVGVVATGYGDGYPRHAKDGTPVLVNGKRVPLVGRVSMDMLTVDLRSQPNAKISDPVLLWGDELPVEIVAQHADTIAYQLVCGIHRRVPMVVVQC